LEILRKSLKRIIINVGSINITIDDIGNRVINLDINHKKISNKHDINLDLSILDNKSGIPCSEDLYSCKIIIE